MRVIYLTSERQTIRFIYEKFFGKVIIDNFIARLSRYLKSRTVCVKRKFVFQAFSHISREISINVKNCHFALEKHSKYSNDSYS